MADVDHPKATPMTQESEARRAAERLLAEEPAPHETLGYISDVAKVCNAILSTPTSSADAGAVAREWIAKQWAAPSSFQPSEKTLAELLTSFAAQARRTALEEAARLLEARVAITPLSASAYLIPCAAAIRSLT